MDVMRAIESIIAELKTLQESFRREEVSKTMLENSVNQLEKEVLFCHNPKYAKEIVEENKRLQGAVGDLTSRLDVSKDIINGMRMIIESVKSEVKPVFMTDHAVELYKQGISVLRLSQLYGTSKATIITILRQAGFEKLGNPKSDNEQGEDEAAWARTEVTSQNSGRF